MQISDSISALIAGATGDLVETRHFLHQRPELSDSEEQTAAFVAERLRALGLQVRTGAGGHGVVAEANGSRQGRTIAIRADMDALPIQEVAGKAYCSQNPGVMHACGHDGHTTICLGTAAAISKLRSSFAGRVRFIFQPSEETVGGAKRVCEAGAMEGVDAVVALHGWPDLEVGQIGVRDGPMMASQDTFDIQIIGAGGHAAYPHKTIDPIVIGSRVVSALQSIVSREIDPFEPVVVTVTQFHSGTAYNVIPGTANLAGTYRTLSAVTRVEMPERIRRIAEGVCFANRATCKVTFREGTAPVLNHADVNSLVTSVAADVLGAENVVTLAHPSMGAEDFSEYLNYAPGAMFRLGLGDVTPLHTPTFDFTDAALPVGVELFTRIALRYLE